MEKRKVDVAVIGAGTAGMGAYRAARRFTDNLVLIEGAHFGTTCARVGCMPSKLLIAAADAAHSARHGDLFGIQAREIRVDGPAVKERVRSERDRFVDSVLEAINDMPESHRVRGHARFLSPHRLAVGDELEIEADRIVIATGSSPKIPKFLKAAGERLIVNDDVFEWQDLPGSVAVFGPGVIGLELGQALSRLGVRVRMFGSGGSIGPIQDIEIHQCAYRVFNEEFSLHPEADTRKVELTDKGVAVTFVATEDGGKEVTETFDYLLAATGRQPNVNNLDLQNTDLELDKDGLPRFDRYTLRCGDSHIFIAGDVNAELPLLHEAADEGRIAGTNAGQYPEVRAGLRRVPLSVVFTDPQIATVGKTIHQVDEDCRGRFAVGSVSFVNQGRSRVIGKNQGLLRVYGEHGSGLFMGAEMFGPSAEHIGHLLAWAVQQRMTVSEMLDMPFYHPVIEEGVRTALRDLRYQLSLGPKEDLQSLDCGPGG